MMKISSSPIHLFLFTLFPLLFLFADNVKEIPLRDIFLPALISLAITTTIWIILRNFLGGKKSALIISVVLIVWIVVSQIRVAVINIELEMLQILGSNKLLIPIFFVISVPAIIYIIKKNISNESIPIVNVISMVIFGFLIFQVVNYDSTNMEEYSAIKENIRIPIIQSDVVDKPDVYFILLDAYSGDVTLEKDYNFDNSKFKNELRDRGFFVQEPSYSNYPNTEAALPSILNMMYLDSINEIVGKDSDDKKILIELRDGNNVMDIFNNNGYDLTYIFGGATASPSDDTEFEIVCGRGFLNMNEDLQRSIVHTYFSVQYLRTMMFNDFRAHDIQCARNEVLNFENNDQVPQYLHVHMYLPHPPLIYDSEGNKIQNTFSYNRFDPSLRDAYLEQTIYTNKITIEMIDSIQQKDDSAVIIVMSDHGGRLGINWENPTVMDYNRAFNNLSAFYFPGHENEIPEGITPVNAFRVFFNTYLDTDYEILEDRQMWYVPERPYDQIDVTEKLGR